MVWMKVTMRSHAAACWSFQRPAQPGVMRPSADTQVISPNTRPAPPRARAPRCTVHLGARALGGAGLVFSEMTCVSADGRITPGCAGLWNDQQAAAWKRIVTFIHTMTPAKAGLQLGHAGRKGSTQLGWQQIDQPLEEGNWPLISASPIPYHGNGQVPREMTRRDMDEVKADFVAAARRGAHAGFDVLELHCAHGYLLSSFLSPLTNTRNDEYGGGHENRARYLLEIFRAVREVWP